jgi:hypothetical protein
MKKNKIIVCYMANTSDTKDKKEEKNRFSGS